MVLTGKLLHLLLPAIGSHQRSGFRQIPAEYKVNIYVKIAQLYLEEDESVQAEIYIKRASQFISEVKDGTLILRFKVRVLFSLFTFPRVRGTHSPL
jgi:hypothetical protein